MIDFESLEYYASMDALVHDERFDAIDYDTIVSENETKGRSRGDVTFWSVDDVVFGYVDGERVAYADCGDIWFDTKQEAEDYMNRNKK